MTRSEAIDPIRWAFIPLVLAAVISGCATKGTDGSTHFLCGSDSECPAEQVCVARQCVSRTVGGDAALTAGDANLCLGTDLSSDPANCGTCGHACGPMTLASGSGQMSFVIDAANVYWTDASAGTVMKAPLQGGSPTTLAAGQNLPGAIAVDAANVYFTARNSSPPTLTTPGSVKKVPISGGSVVTLASRVMGDLFVIAPDRLVVTATGVVFVATTVVAGGAFSTTVDVETVPLTGGTPVSLGVPAQDFLVVGDTIVWAQRPFTDTGTISKQSVLGGDPVTLVSGLFTVPAIAVDSTNVYWVDEGACGEDGGVDGGCTASIRSVPLGGGSTATLASNLPRSSGGSGSLAVSGSNVYRVATSATGEGSITDVPNSGGSAITLASGQAGMAAFAFDATHAYWIDKAPSGVAGGRAKVMKASIADTSPTVLASLAPLPSPGVADYSGMVVDATHVYVNDGRNILAVPLGGIACRAGQCE